MHLGGKKDKKFKVKQMSLVWRRGWNRNRHNTINELYRPQKKEKKKANPGREIADCAEM